MSDASFSFQQLLSAVGGEGAAFRIVTRLQPTGGPGDKVFPPTYANDHGTKYALETRRIDGNDVACVLLDSVASQANRIEVALRDAWERGRVAFPVISVDFSEVEGLEDLDRITVLDAPHRIADAILRDSLLDGVPFRASVPGEALTQSSPTRATPLLYWSPTALLMGVWDSTGPRGGLGSKFPRTIVSEVIGVGVQEGVKVGSRLDPLGIEIKAATLYEAKDPLRMWTLDTDAAKREKGKPKKYGRSKSDSGKPSAANHGNIAPSLDKDAGGVTFDYALQTTVLSLTALRRLRFPTDVDGQPVERSRRVAFEDHARALLAALGLVGIALDREQGYWFRSRCELVPESGQPTEIELIGRYGQVLQRFVLTSARAISLLEEAVATAPEGLRWHTEEITLQPAPKLVTLVRRSRDLTIKGEAEAS